MASSAKGKSKRLQGKRVAVHFQGLVKSDWVGGGGGGGIWVPVGK